MQWFILSMPFHWVSIWSFLWCAAEIGYHVAVKSLWQMVCWIVDQDGLIIHLLSIIWYLFNSCCGSETSKVCARPPRGSVREMATPASAKTKMMDLISIASLKSGLNWAGFPSFFPLFSGSNPYPILTWNISIVNFDGRVSHLLYCLRTFYHFLISKE